MDGDAVKFVDHNHDDHHDDYDHHDASPIRPDPGVPL
jgi:hypothetical protein